MTDFSKPDERKRWLEAHSQDAAVILAVRAALRSVPEPFDHRRNRVRLSKGDRDIALKTFRCLAVSWAWAAGPPDHRSLFETAASIAASQLMDPAHPAAAAALYSAAATFMTTDCVDSASIAIGHALNAAISANTNAFEAMSRAISTDAGMLERNVSAITLWPLWPNGMSDWWRDQWRGFKSLLLLNRNNDWKVWTDWYEERLDGKLLNLNQAIELARVTIPDELRKRAPAMVARIKELPKGHDRVQEHAAIPDPADHHAFEHWLSSKPHWWAIAIAARVALRVLPQIDLNQYVLPFLRAVAISRFAAMHQSREAIDAAGLIAGFAFTETHTTFDAAAHAVAAAAAIATNSSHAIDAIAAATDVAMHQEDVAASVLRDAQALNDGWLAPEDLVADKLWIRDHRSGAEHEKVPTWAIDEWSELCGGLRRYSEHWSVWIDWYEHVVEGSPRSEAWEAAFTDVPGPLPWSDGPGAVNAEIAKRLEQLATTDTPQLTTETQQELQPVEGITSPIAVVERPDGRIGVDAGSWPVFPPSIPPEDHGRVVSACRSRADQLCRTASHPSFNGRSDYAEALAAYVEWLPDAPNTGNILLADGEARLLNKLFTADQEILATGFASRLAVLLEDHIALRAYYPEIERHYLTVRTGRIATPLERDAVEGIQRVIRENTPTVFEESLDDLMGEAGKQVPEIRSPRPEDAPTFDPNQPRPPKDPIGEVDPQQSRNWIFASAFNRIWGLVLKGKDVHESAEGWQQTYHQMKPYVGPILHFLRMFLSSGGDGAPPMPPTIMT